MGCNKRVGFLILVFIFMPFLVAFVDARDEDFIKWVDCKVPYEVLLTAYEYEVKFYGDDEVDFCFIKSLAYLATKNGNNFRTKRDLSELSDLVIALIGGKKIDDFYGENKYYKFYVAAYTAIFKEFIGEIVSEGGMKVRGLKNVHPFPKGYWYNHYDDFGASRSFGFDRKHLGHDMMGATGTPIVAIESGIVTELGWNKYGGWIITIRSHDKNRAYYYAHLRKGKPYVEGLKLGDNIAAGDVIGYLGTTGYSTKEDSNMTGSPHLHLGMQLIFDESQVKGPTEIWIDMYQITKFLSHNRVSVEKIENDYRRVRE